MGNSNTLGTRIVVPLDGSTLADQALPYAQAMAAPNAEFVLVRVTPAQRPADALRFGPDRVSGDHGPDPIDLRIERTVTRFRRSAGHHVDILLDRGDPATAILRVARGRAADLIVIAGEGWRAPAKRYRGSVADRIAREAEMSVLFIPSREKADAQSPPALRRLVVPLDGSAHALRTVDAAVTVAERRGVPIRLIVAVDPAYGAPPSAVPDAERDARDAIAEQRGEALRMLEAIGAGLLRRGASATWQVVDAAPTDAILGSVADGDLIVLASRGRGAANGWPIGSVTEKVARYAPVPVLVLHAPPIDDVEDNDRTRRDGIEMALSPNR